MLPNVLWGTTSGFRRCGPSFLLQRVVPRLMWCVRQGDVLLAPASRARPACASTLSAGPERHVGGTSQELHELVHAMHTVHAHYAASHPTPWTWEYQRRLDDFVAAFEAVSRDRDGHTSTHALDFVSNAAQVRTLLCLLGYDMMWSSAFMS